MIRLCDNLDTEVIHQIINDAAQAYKGVIPEDRYHEPYMSIEELNQEFRKWSSNESMDTSIYFIRHAVSPFSLGNERTRGLSDAGLEAARKVANLLKHEGIEYIFSSPYTRAIETVSFLAKSLNKEVIEIEELRERAVGSLDVEIDKEEFFQGVRMSFIDKDYCLPGGETIRDAQGRAIPIIKQLLKDYRGKKVAIGTHGNIMTAIINYFNDEYGYDFWKSTTMPDVYRLDFEGDRLIGLERLWE